MRSRPLFQEYAGDLLEYLRFKQLPVPSKCTVSAVVHADGLASTKPNAGGLTADPAFADVVAGINLSDEEAALVYVNLGACRFAARTVAAARCWRAGARCRRHRGDLSRGRVALRPGEACNSCPRISIASDGDTRGRSEIDVQLVLRGE